MSEGDILVVKNPGTIRVYITSDRTTEPTRTATIKPGEPVKDSPEAHMATLLANGDPELGVDVFIGIAYRESTDTSSADGEVEVTTLNTGTVLRGKATDTFTAAELLTYYNNNVCFDLATGAFTIDDDETDDPDRHGLRIIAGDSNMETLDVIPNIMVTEHAPYIH